MRASKFLLAASIILVSSVLYSQGTGTPSQIRVITDATSALVVSAASQTLPLSQPTTFSNTRLRTDAANNLQVVLVGGIPSGSFPLLAPSGGCATPSYSFTINSGTGMLALSTSLGWAVEGVCYLGLFADELQVKSTAIISFSGSTVGQPSDTRLSKHAVGILKYCAAGPGADECLTIDGDTSSDTIIFTVPTSPGTPNFTFNGNILSTSSVRVATNASFLIESKGTLSASTDGMFQLANINFDASGGLNHRYIVEVNTTSKAPTAMESGELYTNTGDGDGSTFTLPNDPAVTGLKYFFSSRVAQTMTISPSAGESILSNGATCTNVVIGAATGEFLELVNITSGSGAVWTPGANNGGFTCTP